jgi:hypothetical protein
MAERNRLRSKQKKRGAKMSQYNSGKTITCEVSADLSSKQYCFMKLGTDGRVTYSTATTDKIVGVLQDDPDAAGKGGNVMVDGCSKMIAGTVIAVGNFLTTNNAGKAVPIAGTTELVRAMALEAASAADAEFEVLLIGPCTISS